MRAREERLVAVRKAFQRQGANDLLCQNCGLVSEVAWIEYLDKSIDDKPEDTSEDKQAGRPPGTSRERSQMTSAWKTNSQPTAERSGADRRQ